MARIMSALVAAAVIFSGCAMEQYHFPQTQDKIPAPVIVAFGDKYPNDTIKSITEQKMMDGKTQYCFTSTSSKHPADRVTMIAPDGTVMPDAGM